MTQLAEYLVDTNALYWHMTASQRLSPAGRDVFREASAGHAVLIVSYIVLAELYYVLQKHGAGDRFLPNVLRMTASPAYRFEPITLGDLHELPRYPEVSEMHDRLIAIQAKRIGKPVVTADRALHASSQITCIW